MEQRKKAIVITGASDGIGKAAARQLHALGQDVVLVGRSPEKTKAIAEELGAPYHLCDYARLTDVVRLAEELARYPHIDVLANNAGGIQRDLSRTGDGFDRTFQINLLGGLLLTMKLLDKLSADKATVIQTSSIAANLYGANLDVHDLQNEKHASTRLAYGYSKLEDILMTRELDRRYGERGLAAVAFEPGVARTNFGSETKGFLYFMYHTRLRYLFTISPEQSAKRLVRLALGTPHKDFAPGEVYSNQKPFKLKFQDPDGEISRFFFDECLRMLAPFLG